MNHRNQSSKMNHQNDLNKASFSMSYFWLSHFLFIYSTYVLASDIARPLSYKTKIKTTYFSRPRPVRPRPRPLFQHQDQDRFF